MNTSTLPLDIAWAGLSLLLWIVLEKVVFKRKLSNQEFAIWEVRFFVVLIVAGTLALMYLARR